MNLLLYLGGGILAGAMGGYLGLGGGFIMVPFFTLLGGLEIKEAVPVSVTAIAANSIAASSEYLKRDMVDLRLSVRLAGAVIVGFVVGSLLIDKVPSDGLRLLFSALLLYTAFNMAFKKSRVRDGSLEQTKPISPLTLIITFATGVLAALLGLGGGVVMVPTLFLLGHADLARSRGTWSFTYGFAAVAAMMIYLFNHQVRLELVAPAVAGILLGGKLGGRLGRAAKPTPVKILFIIVIVYSAAKLGWPVVKGWQ